MSTGATTIEQGFPYTLAPTMEKPLIAVIRGGYSGEAVISHQSAACAMKAIDSERFLPVYLTVARDRWTCCTAEGLDLQFDRGTFTIEFDEGLRRVDAALVMIHGSPGEDGHLQGLLDMLGIAYQTGDVLNMAATFSKYTTTALLRTMGFPVAPSVFLTKATPHLLELATTVGTPCFVKPDRAGSSLGISKVSTRNDMQAALDKAFEECDGVMVEGAISGRELTCGVVQRNGEAVALPVCEIRTSHEFFDYDAKYHASDTEEIVPAPIPDAITRMVQERSLAIYHALRCRGMARIDHMWNATVTGNAALVTIEVNTVPGFSEASILPKMLAAAGIPSASVMNSLIEEMLHRSTVG